MKAPKDECRRDHPPSIPGCKLLTSDEAVARRLTRIDDSHYSSVYSLKRVYVKKGRRIILCPKQGASDKYGWCKVREPAV